MPTWGRVVFAAVPLAWAFVAWAFFSENTTFHALLDQSGVFGVFFIFFILFGTLFLVTPFELVLDPVGWWDHDLISFPTKEGILVVIISYVVIFYFVFPTRKVVRAELKEMFGK